MRIMRGAAVTITVLTAGIVLAACATAAPTRSTSLTTATTTAKTAPAMRSPARPASQPAVQRLAAAGNPDGHAFVPPAGRAVNTSHPTRVVGRGTPASCTSAAVVKAVAKGGVITFDCGPTAGDDHHDRDREGRQHQAPGRARRRRQGDPQRRRQAPDPLHGHLRQDADLDHARLRQPAAAAADRAEHHLRRTATPRSGRPGRASAAVAAAPSSPRAAAQGGQLALLQQRLLPVGPDLGGAAIRALAQYRNRPVYITGDTFRGGRCSNGGALSSIGVSWDVLNSVIAGNRAIGWGANPAAPGTPGGGSGGAIYTDGDNYNVVIAGTVIRNDNAREGGGAVFFVVDNNDGTLSIKNSTLHHNPSGEFFTAGFPGIFFHSSGRPIVIASTIN